MWSARFLHDAAVPRCCRSLTNSPPVTSRRPSRERTSPETASDQNRGRCLRHQRLFARPARGKTSGSLNHSPRTDPCCRTFHSKVKCQKKKNKKKRGRERMITLWEIYTDQSNRTLCISVFCSQTFSISGNITYHQQCPSISSHFQTTAKCLRLNSP